jgi:hypothetical protein
VGLFGRTWRWCRRRPAAAALLGVSAAAALAVAGLLVGLWHQERLRGERDLARSAHAEAERQRERAEQARYLNNILLAHSRWLENDAAHARRLLDECPAGLRHWEWDYLHGLAHDELLALADTHAGVTGVAFSPDGRRLYAAGGNPYVPQGDGAANNVKAWDLTGWLTDGDVPLARTFPGRHSWLTCLAVSPDGRLLAASNWDNSVSVWDATERVSPAARVRRRREAEERAPGWHRRHLQESQDAGDAFGLAFHRQWLQGAPRRKNADRSRRRACGRWPPRAPPLPARRAGAPCRAGPRGRGGTVPGRGRPPGRGTGRRPRPSGRREPRRPTGLCRWPPPPR